MCAPRSAPPTEFDLAAHARAGSDRERSGFHVAREYAGLEQLDPGRPVDIAVQFATDSDVLSANLPGEVSSCIDGQVALHADIALKRPAIRTCPLPSILPSIVRSAAITDSFGSTAVRGCSRARRVSALNGTAVGLSASRTEGSRDEVGVVPPVVEACSFQRAITESSPCLERKKPDGKPPRPLGQIEFVSDCADA